MKKIILSICVLCIILISYANSINLHFENRGGQGETINYDVTNYEWDSEFGCNYWVSMTIEISNGIGSRFVTNSSWIYLGNTWNFSVNTASNESIIGESVRIVGFSIDRTLEDANSYDLWWGESCHGSAYTGTEWDHLNGKSYQVAEMHYTGNN